MQRFFYYILWDDFMVLKVLHDMVVTFQSLFNFLSILKYLFYILEMTQYASLLLCITYRKWQ